MNKIRFKWLTVIVTAVIVTAANAAVLGWSMTAYGDEAKGEWIINPSDDAHVDSNSGNTERNYGSQPIMVLKEGGGEYNRRAYLQFPMKDMADFNCAQVRMYFKTPQTETTDLVLYQTAPGWTEDDLTWANAPAAGKEIARAELTDQAGWYTWDVTDYLLDHRGEKAVSMALIGSNTGGNREIYSKEGAFPPELILILDKEPPCLTKAEVSEGNKKITLTFDEAVKSNLGGNGLNEAISMAGDGTDYQALNPQDTVAIEGNKIIITLKDGLTQYRTSIKIKGGTIKDEAGNVVVTDIEEVLPESDLEPPILESAYTVNFNRKIVLVFNEPVLPLRSDEEMEEMVLYAPDHESYQPLPEDTRITAGGKTITITLGDAIPADQVRFRILADTLADLAGNKVRTAITSSQILLEDTEYPYAPPSEEYLEMAMADSQSVTFKNLASADGSQPETIQAGALAVVAMSIASGNRDPQYIERYTDTIRKMLDNEFCMPNLMGGLDSRQQSPLVYAIALLWNDQEIMAEFTEEEISRLTTFMKAGLYSTAYTLSDRNADGSRRDAQRIAVNGDDNCWNGGNTNHSEPNLTIFYSASMVLGLENVSDLLENFKFDDFVKELDAQNLTSISKSFKSITNFGSLEAKKNLMEAIIRSKDWEYKGVGLYEYLANPMKFYHATQSYMWSLTAEDGDYMGQQGMAQEFHSTDQAGVRESASYVVLGIDPSLLNRILLHYYGYWQIPENKTIAEEIDGWQKTGVSDYYAKVINGYYTISWMGLKTEYLTEYKYFIETMTAMGMLKPAAFNDTFNYDGSSELEEAWKLEGSYRAVHDSIIPYNTKKDWTAEHGGSPSDPKEKVLYSESDYGAAYTKSIFSNASCLVWAKPEKDGEFGILGRVKNRENGYLLVCNGSDAAVKVMKEGKVQTLKTVPYVTKPGQAYRLRGVFTDDSITFYIDGKEVVSVSDDTYREGGIGVYNKGTAAKFDAVLVQNTKAGVPDFHTLKAGDGCLKLKFDAVEGAMGYRIFYGIESGNYTESFATGSTTPVIEGLQNGTRYYVAVSALTESGDGEPSGELSAVPSIPTAVAPILNSVIPAGREVILNFTADPVNTSYIIRYGTAPGEYTQEITEVKDTGCKVKLPCAQVPYYFVVIGENEQGEGAPSNEMSGAANSRILFEDDFESGVLTGRWIVNHGSAEIVHGTVKTGKADPERLWPVAGDDWDNYEVTTAFTLPKGQTAVESGILGRVDTASNYYIAGYKYEDGKGYATLRIKVNGGFIQDKNVEFRLDDSIAEHEMKAVFQGSNIKLYLDGVLAYDQEDDTLEKGRAGLFSAKTETVFHDFQITLLDGPAVPKIDAAKASDGAIEVMVSGSDEVSGYKVKYGTSSGNYTGMMVTEPGAAVKLADLKADKVWFITASAYRDRYEGENAAEVVVAGGEAPDITGIEVKTLPDRTEYEIGDQLDTTGMVVTASSSNASRIQLDDSQYTVSRLDSETPGVKEITVSAISKNGNTYTDTFTVAVNGETTFYTTGIKITKRPEKMIYGIGEEFISDGMVVKAVRKASPSDADRIEVPITDYETAYDFSEAGEKRVVISHTAQNAEGEEIIFTADLSVTVKEALAEENYYTSRIKISRKPDKIVYLKGENFNPAGIEVMAVEKKASASNAVRETDVTDEVEYRYNFDSPGTKKVTVVYYGMNKKGEEKEYKAAITVEIQSGSSHSSNDSSETVENQVTVITPMSGQWEKNGDNWIFRKNDGSLARNEWGYINGKWYFFQENGMMAVSWVWYKNHWYYLNSDGAMAEDSWVFYDGRWYYLQKDGSMSADQWIKYHEVWYYLREDGSKY